MKLRLQRSKAAALAGLLAPIALVATALISASATAAAAELRTVDLRGLEARSAALLLSGQQTGDLEAAFLARRLAPSDTEEPILLVADLVGDSLLDAAGGRDMILEIYAYALSGGQPRATLSRAFRLEPASHRATLEGGGVKFLGRIAPPAGAAVDEVRLLVLHRASGRFVLHTLAVPPAASPPSGTEPPLVLEPAEPWILARDPADPATAPIGARLPAARLAASTGGSLRLSLAGASDDPTLGARLLDGAGEPLAELAVERLAAQPEPALVAARIDLPAHPPGAYLLELGSPGGAASRVPLDLVGESLTDGDPWFRRLQPAERPELAAADPPPVGGRSALAERALTAYHRAFEAWLAGDLDGATGEIERFEAGAAYTGQTASLSIEEGQVRAAAELAARDGEALVPLMALHERLYRRYRASDRPQLATHSRRLAGEFARLYAARGGREAARISALVPVSLAGVRQQQGARNAAQAAFERALEMDPRQPEALLGLAALHESFAHYETTVELLRRRARGGALPPEARMRLAVNLGRIGAHRQAAAHLRELLEARPEWIARLAHQELARLLTAAGRDDEALELLVEARRRHPEDQALIIQQAALLDRLGKPLAGQRVLEALDGLADGGDSPRLRYSELPTLEIERARDRLAGAAVERLAGILEQTRAIRAGEAP